MTFMIMEGGTPAPMSSFCAVICICRREADDHPDGGEGLDDRNRCDRIVCTIQYKKKKGCVTVHTGRACATSM